VMYCSNYISLFARVWLSGWLCDDVWWSSIDGERFVGDQEQYFDQDHQDQQGYFENQGKYSLGLYIALMQPWSYDLNDVYAMNVKHDF
jgi:hypothetical protein